MWLVFLALRNTNRAFGAVRLRSTSINKNAEHYRMQAMRAPSSPPLVAFLFASRAQLRATHIYIYKYLVDIYVRWIRMAAIVIHTQALGPARAISELNGMCASLRLHKHLFAPSERTARRYCVYAARALVMSSTKWIKCSVERFRMRKCEFGVFDQIRRYKLSEENRNQSASKSPPSPSS